MEKYKFQSKNEETLLEKACEELKITKEEMFYKTYEEKGGLFSGKKYILEAVKIEDVCELGKQILKQLLEYLGMKANVETYIRENQINFQIYSNNNSILIGKRGHILDSIQVFIRQAIYNATEIFANITVDVEKYKEKQNYFFEKKIKQIARDVKRDKTEVKLDPMTSYERRNVHTILQNFKNITTGSVGEEPNRCIVIKYKENNEE